MSLLTLAITFVPVICIYLVIEFAHRFLPAVRRRGSGSGFPRPGRATASPFELIAEGIAAGWESGGAVKKYR